MIGGEDKDKILHIKSCSNIPFSPDIADQRSSKVEKLQNGHITVDIDPKPFGNESLMSAEYYNTDVKYSFYFSILLDTITYLTF